MTDLDVAAGIGADVAFCLAGQGRARVRGIGEIVEDLPSEPGTVTLIVPPFSVSTPAVYRAFDEIRPDEKLGTPVVISGVNDLERAAMVVEPRLRQWRDDIFDASDQTPILAGSGSTWFVMGDHGYLATRLPEATVVVTGYQ